jgi:hypothetical protein
MKVFAIDLDGTALVYPEKVNALYEHPDHLILIYTARSSSIRERTERELREAGIKYHALIMDKVRADVYIDDKNEGGLRWPS